VPAFFIKKEAALPAVKKKYLTLNGRYDMMTQVTAYGFNFGEVAAV